MKKDAAVEKILHELGLKQEPELTPEQEELYNRATNPEEQFFYDVERLFASKDKEK